MNRASVENDFHTPVAKEGLEGKAFGEGAAWSVQQISALSSLPVRSGEVERVMDLIEQRLCIVWSPRENRDAFEAELRAALDTSPGEV